MISLPEYGGVDLNRSLQTTRKLQEQHDHFRGTSPRVLQPDRRRSHRQWTPLSTPCEVPEAKRLGNVPDCRIPSEWWLRKSRQRPTPDLPRAPSRCKRRARNEQVKGWVRALCLERQRTAHARNRTCEALR